MRDPPPCSPPRDSTALESDARVIPYASACCRRVGEAVGAPHIIIIIIIVIITIIIIIIIIMLYRSVGASTQTSPGRCGRGDHRLGPGPQLIFIYISAIIYFAISYIANIYIYTYIHTACNIHTHLFITVYDVL